MIKQYLLLLAVILGVVGSASAQTISCSSGFSSSGSCGVSPIGAGGQPFQLVGTANGSNPGIQWIANQPDPQRFITRSP